MAALLEVDGVRAGFGANTVLHGVSYSVQDGEIATVLGLNGAGKSVSLKVVAGIVPVWAGAVRFAGDDMTSVPAEERVRRGMAHVPQGRQVFPDLSVEQNLRLGAYVLRRRDKSRYPAALERVYEQFPILRERRQQSAGNLSGGEQAMLAVGRALMSEPRLILVDEATAGLSPTAVELLYGLLRQVNESGVTILMVEQNVTFSLRLADSVHIMQKGQIVYEGAVGTLDQNQVADYLGVGQLLGSRLRAVAKSRRTKADAPSSRLRTRSLSASAGPRGAGPSGRKASAPKAVTPKKAAAKKTAAKKVAAPKKTATPSKAKGKKKK